MKLRVQARAKINWSLDIVGTLPNGYHDLDMLMQSVTLCDQMRFEDAEGLSLSMRMKGSRYLPADERNLVLRAARALQEATGCRKGARISLAKYIPVAAGMGGGSSDAAATLVALNRMWGTGLTDTELEKIGVTIGSDVPFCVCGGLQRAQGVGDRLTRLPMRRELYLAAFQPCRGLSTKEVFSRIGGEGEESSRPDNVSGMEALRTGNVKRLSAALGNVLEPVACEMRPAIREAIDALLAEGAAGARMTGSGSAVFGVFENAALCRRAVDALAGRYHDCRMMRTAREGVVITRLD